MFALALFCLVAISFADVRQHVVRSDITDIELQALFSEFKGQFDKTYASVEEHQARYEIFKDNYKRAIQYQSQEKASAKYGITKFADLSASEFRSKYLSTMVPEQPKIDQKIANYSRSLIPTMAQSVDWRKQGAVTPVKNQGQCGSCWSFSATGNLEGARVVQAKGSLVSLSEQQLMDCSVSFGNHGCEGGLPTLADKYVVSAGIEPESVYPYTAMDGTCHYDKSKVVATATGYTAFPKLEEPTVAAWLSENGPVSLGINAGPLQMYLDDVIHLSALFCNPTHLDHGVLFVGYDLTKTNSEYEYWIIKNSWGADWGLSGYFKIEYNHNICGVGEMPSTATGVKATN